MVWSQIPVPQTKIRPTWVFKSARSPDRIFAPNHLRYFFRLTSLNLNLQASTKLLLVISHLLTP
jgi:hypothetical protein